MVSSEALAASSPPPCCAEFPVKELITTVATLFSRYRPPPKTCEASEREVRHWLCSEGAYVSE